METRLDLEAMQNFIKGLATSVNEIKDEFVVVHDTAQEIKSAVVNEAGTISIEMRLHDIWLTRRPRNRARTAA